MLRDASRESQLLDDFEWKLGEIEREYKKKLAEVEKATEERVKKEMAAENQQLLEDKRGIDEKLAEVSDYPLWFLWNSLTTKTDSF